jgi:dienelactone hydrolase
MWMSLLPILAVSAQEARMDPLPNTEPLTLEGDLAAHMVAGIKEFLLEETVRAAERRGEHWTPDFNSPEAYAASVEPNRDRLREIVGAVDPRPQSVDMELVATTDAPALIAEGRGYRVYAVRWEAFEDVHGEGLLLRPEGTPRARVIALPECDWTPEGLIGLAESVPVECQYARRLAESGCEVIVPVLLDRSDEFSGHPNVRYTNQPHREFVYRMAFEMGRHPIGYEVQKVLAAVDWCTAQGTSAPVGVIGYGEGGLIAFYSAALDGRIAATCVSGYFQPREALYLEPIYRNLFGLLEQFGDAEIAGLIAPRPLIIEACETPQVDGPPPVREGRGGGAAPGVLRTPPLEEVRSEFARVQATYERLGAAAALRLVISGEGHGPCGTGEALGAFLEALAGEGPDDGGDGPTPTGPLSDPDVRMKRQVEELCAHTQTLLRRSERTRAQLWAQADRSSPQAFEQTSRGMREFFWEDVIGRLPPASLPANPRTRLVRDEPKWRGYEVVLDVWPHVIAEGILLLPKDRQPDERRPVVVCQHGLEGRPEDTLGPPDNPYSAFSVSLVERGFVVYAPQNPYIGMDDFRVLQRVANPLKKTLFSVIVRQHERTLEWLSEQPFVDPARIGFYGISYGGKTAMRVPAMLTQYCLSICSADFNEWVLKNASWDDPFSYVFTGEYEIFEWDLGHTFNYAEMAYLIAPRPFMVERGHHDGVGIDEWVAYEYAKVRRLYAALGIAEQTEIEFLDGGHMIFGQGTFDFLHKHLDWPQR